MMEGLLFEGIQLLHDTQSLSPILVSLHNTHTDTIKILYSLIDKEREREVVGSGFIHTHLSFY